MFGVLTSVVGGVGVWCAYLCDGRCGCLVCLPLWWEVRVFGVLTSVVGGVGIWCTYLCSGRYGCLVYLPL